MQIINPCARFHPSQLPGQHTAEVQSFKSLPMVPPEIFWKMVLLGEDMLAGAFAATEFFRLHCLLMDSVDIGVDVRASENLMPTPVCGCGRDVGRDVEARCSDSGLQHSSWPICPLATPFATGSHSARVIPCIQRQPWQQRN